MPIRRARKPQASRHLVAACSLVLAVLVIAPAVPAQPAGATPLGGQQALSSQAASLQAELVVTAAQLHALAVRTAAAAAQSTRDNQQLAEDRLQVIRVGQELTGTRLALRAVALATYMDDSGSGGTSLDFLSGTSSQLEARQEYVSLSNGTMAGAIDNYRRSKIALVKDERSADGEAIAAKKAVAALADQSNALHQTVVQEQSMLADVQARQQALARRAALAAAQAAAAAQQQAAARASAAAAAQAQAQAQAQAAQAQAAQAAQGVPLAVSVGVLATPAGSGTMAEDLARLRQCESGDDYQANTGNGYYGAYQFALSTWQSLGYSGLPSAAPPAEQDQAAMALQAASGWGQWPVCAAMLGLY